MEPKCLPLSFVFLFVFTIFLLCSQSAAGLHLPPWEELESPTLSIKPHLSQRRNRDTHLRADSGGDNPEPIISKTKKPQVIRLKLEHGEHSVVHRPTRQLQHQEDLAPFKEEDYGKDYGTRDTSSRITRHPENRNSFASQMDYDRGEYYDEEEETRSPGQINILASPKMENFREEYDTQDMLRSVISRPENRNNAASRNDEYDRRNHYTQEMETRRPQNSNDIVFPMEEAFGEEYHTQYIAQKQAKDTSSGFRGDRTHTSSHSRTGDEYEDMISQNRPVTPCYHGDPWSAYGSVSGIPHINRRQLPEEKCRLPDPVEQQSILHGCRCHPYDATSGECLCLKPQEQHQVMNKQNAGEAHIVKRDPSRIRFMKRPPVWSKHVRAHGVGQSHDPRVIYKRAPQPLPVAGKRKGKGEGNKTRKCKGPTCEVNKRKIAGKQSKGQIERRDFYKQHAEEHGAFESEL